jgi:hypothetical protein
LGAVARNRLAPRVVRCTHTKYEKAGHRTPQKHQMAWESKWGGSEGVTKVREQSVVVVGRVWGGGGPRRGVRMPVLEPGKRPPKHTPAHRQITCFGGEQGNSPHPWYHLDPRRAASVQKPRPPAPHNTTLSHHRKKQQCRRVREGDKLQRTPPCQDSPMYG